MPDTRTPRTPRWTRWCLIAVLLTPAAAEAGKPSGPIEKREAAAEALEESGDHVAASRRWSELYDLVPETPVYGFYAGRAAMAADQCNRARRFLDHYLSLGESEGHKREFEQAQELRQEVTAKCPPLEGDAALEHAKELFAAGESHAAAGEWEDALYSYEEAYFLAPDKHGFAFKIGNAAHELGMCTKAQTYLAHYKQNADRSRHEDWQASADRILNTYETMGCEEMPPPADDKGGCSIAF